MNLLIDCISIDLFKTIPALVHGCSPRHYRKENGERVELDLGGNVDKETVRFHRKLFQRSLRISNEPVFLVRQIHSDRVCVLKSAAIPGTHDSLPEADAIITHLSNRPIGVLTADCIPIVIYDQRLHIIGVIHAGRRGTGLNILSKTVAVLKDEYGCRPGDLLAGMGPGIGGCCYEVDDKSLDLFRENYPEWEKFVKKSSKGTYWLDLSSANEADALSAGIPQKQMAGSGNCTSCENDRLFSYRREGTDSRMMTLAMLRPK